MLLKVAFPLVNAGIAQLVEQLICNQQVVGSNPSAGSSDKAFVSSHLFQNLDVLGVYNLAEIPIHNFARLF